MTGPIPPEAQAQDALALVLQAAGHGLQGDMALFRGAPTPAATAPPSSCMQGPDHPGHRPELAPELAAVDDRGQRRARSASSSRPRGATGRCAGSSP